ncbi:MAG TPA: Gfo/Idh/MocA family oxidoreductase [Planctomycetota bacterium]|nr:Gfo/Idh/MocA family oxidoreductase [Planctomycetota bacterium]
MHSDFQISRRDFIRRAALAAAATGLPLWYLKEQLGAEEIPAPPKDKPNIALIGCGGQGRGDTKNAANFGKVIAVCDVDSKRAGEASKQFGDAKVYSDFRKLLERDDLHAVVNATPDHWHTLVNLAALKAGKDIYSEKPLTLTIDEGRRLVQAAEKSKRVFQTGSQQRSDAKFRLACELVRNGRIGKLQHVITSLPAGPNKGPFEKVPVPPELDWNTWQGQTAEHDYMKERCHQTFRYWLDYSGGTMTDWGAHHNDIALWGIGLERSGPVSIEGKALVAPIPGGYTAPSEYQVDYVYANGVTQRCQSTVENNPSGGKGETHRENEIPHGVKFIGSDGWIFVTRGKIDASKPELLKDPLTNKQVELYVSNNHMGNFFDCIKSRIAPICDAEIGHRSVSVCHLGVLAIRLGRKLKWDPAAEQFVDDKEANSYVAREQRKPFDYGMV